MDTTARDFMLRRDDDNVKTEVCLKRDDNWILLQLLFSTIIIVISNEFCTATVKQLTLSHCTRQRIDRFGLELS